MNVRQTLFENLLYVQIGHSLLMLAGKRKIRFLFSLNDSQCRMPTKAWHQQLCVLLFLQRFRVIEKHRGIDQDDPLLLYYRFRHTNFALRNRSSFALFFFLVLLIFQCNRNKSFGPCLPLTLLDSGLNSIHTNSSFQCNLRKGLLLYSNRVRVILSVVAFLHNEILLLLCLSYQLASMYICFLLDQTI